ncbi:hypothetical protein ACN9J3_08065 [Aliarcobacter butzleri]|uniref:hypothetical protein n=1 Tax=Aliarcobacter butzleri TaxID=28197 RepID=UPI003B224060
MIAKFLSDQTIDTSCIHLVIQQYISPYSEKGHLSNERRIHKDRRDWSLEIERRDGNDFFPMGLRNWREEINLNKFENILLYCNLESNLKSVLSIVAYWSTDKKLRLHFEWVWDGKYLYVVQADKENENIGVNPSLINDIVTKDYSSELKCLKLIEDEHAHKYPKINNVVIYRKLNLPIAPLYVLDDQVIIKQIAKGKIPQILKNDIGLLIQSPLIIRTDINSDEKMKRQMLPRVEQRDYKSSLEWLKKYAKILLADKNLHNIDIAFIFHNFIPAVSSAFAYSKPGNRNVQIEALWGLPEGLYFYSHDKYVVDTKYSDINNVKSFDQFNVEGRLLYKPFFVKADDKGNWNTQKVLPPRDWSASIKNEDWIKQIAFHSRRISEEVGKSLSIMWFIDVSDGICKSKVFPWHHEPFNLSEYPRNKISRTKTPFDMSLVIKTFDDLKLLEEESEKENTKIRKIHIQPIDEKLLRDKDVLQKIGKLSKKIDAFILLEGSMLTHAYYQLLQTGAVVETISNYNNFEHVQEFNKLVRDKIPENIENGGEIVQIAKMEKSSIIKALKDKLIEESFEVLDAENDDILEELADVYEVIDGLLYHMGIDKSLLLKKQRNKAEKVGAFFDGKVLIETKKPIPTSTMSQEKLLFTQDELKETTISYDLLPKKEIYKYRDIRKLSKSINENLLRFKIPFTNDSWQIDTKNIPIDNNNKAIVNISGKRINSEYQIEINIYSKREEQTKLDLNDGLN